ncbi:MAG: hypothetical protein COU69_04435 [Candidatus Pacebacteria bacterium CG10_big_fil_rev_8_21_14_0_10_56_10]|nr:MAG: hypothetical protein COU69_04435 [Candidatus Pacebacteria bacterium CG10_big_fil_rev_8_21_14_0_10_56_10]
MSRKRQLRVSLICDNKIREYDSLLLLQEKLRDELHAQVKIFGSIAEIQRIYFMLHKFQPDVVILPQVQEKSCRELADYVRKSGGIVGVLPSEVTLSDTMVKTVVNDDTHYDRYVDLFFFPGKDQKKHFLFSDLSASKMFVTGSPKIDVSVLAAQRQPMSRKEFSTTFQIPLNRKINIFVFTSFPISSEDYQKKDISFSKSIPFLRMVSKYIRLTKESYLQMIPLLAGRFSNCNIILKPHPLELVSTYSSLNVPNLHIVDKATIHQCFGSIDLAIHWTSTVASECWINDVKTIQYSPFAEYDEHLIDLTPGNPLFHTREELFAGITHYLKHPLEPKYLRFQRQYLRNNFYLLDGMSSGRIASVIKRNLRFHKTKPSYSRGYSYLFFVQHLLDRWLGPVLVRRIMSSLFRSKSWRYAQLNYLPY